MCSGAAGLVTIDSTGNSLCINDDVRHKRQQIEEELKNLQKELTTTLVEVCQTN